MNFNIDINSFPSKRRHMSDDRYFKLACPTPYATIQCAHDGIVITGVDKPSNEVFTTRMTGHGVLLPTPLQKAYGIAYGEAFDVFSLGNNQWFIYKQLSPRKALPTLPVAGEEVKFEKEKAELVDMLSITASGHINLDLIKEYLPYEEFLVSCSMDKGLRIDISKAGGSALSLNTLKEYFGKHLQEIAGPRFEFIVDKKTTTIRLPKSLLDMWDAKNKPKKLEVYLTRNSRCGAFLTFAPKAVEDLITGETVDYKEESPVPVVMCEECYDKKTNIQAVAREFLALAQMFVEVADKFESVNETNSSLEEENERLRRELEFANAKNKQIVEALSGLTAIIK